jgi:type IV pilus assembly protein PilA
VALGQTGGKTFNAGVDMARHPRGFTLLETMVAVAITGILAAAAIPSFMRFQARAKQSEAKANLKALFVAERSYYLEANTYTASFPQCGFSVERGNRYAYTIGVGFFGLELRWAVSSLIFGSPGTVNEISVDFFKYPTAVILPPPVPPLTITFDPASVVTGFPAMDVSTCPAAPSCNWIATAAGNIDSDVTIDTWFISNVDASGVTAPGRDANNTAAPAGEPQLSNNDVSF